VSLFSEVEKALDLRFRKWTEKIFGPHRSDDLVLLRRAILDQIGSKIETIGRGERIFPYNHLHVCLASPDSGRRELLEAAFGGGRLQTDVREQLALAGCQAPAGFSVELETVEAGAKQFEILYEVRNLTLSPVNFAPARLEVVGAKADRNSYLLDAATTNIGRLKELTDQRERIIRRNDIVLQENADAGNATVSRAHAHIAFDAQTGEYRIYDDSSEHGTRIIRGGRPIEVPAGSRGERLRAGDEICLGRVCLRFLQSAR
jgi:hypothetical protein